jgi:hypothetical protein
MQSGPRTAESVRGSIERLLAGCGVVLAAVMTSLMLGACGGPPPDPFAGTYSMTGDYAVNLVIAPADDPTALPTSSPPGGKAQSTASPDPDQSALAAIGVEDLPTIAPGDPAYDWYTVTFYLGKEKPFDMLLVRRGDGLYAATTTQAGRRGEFNAEMFRSEAGSLTGMTMPILATQWHRTSEATKNPPW